MTFADKFEEFELFKENSWAAQKRLQTEFDAACAAEFKRLYPKRKMPECPITKLPDIETFRAPWDEMADKMLAAQITKIEEYERALHELALRPTPVTCDLYQMDRESGSSYATQGYGANKYAFESLRQRADKAEFHGLIAEVRKIGEHRVAGTYPWTVEEYGLFVNTTTAGWEMVKRRPDTPLREWVRLCWKRGVNPRVYYPFLPHGYEEKEGLDFLGGEIQRREDCALTRGERKC